jgi:hypothetical protein
LSVWLALVLTVELLISAAKSTSESKAFIAYNRS